AHLYYPLPLHDALPIWSMWKTSCTVVCSSAQKADNTKHAPDRISEDKTYVEESFSCPLITTWCPSTCASAPRRSISSTKRNRDSKTFSVMTAVPSAMAERPIAMGCKSVGKPGKGSVW